VAGIHDNGGEGTISLGDEGVINVAASDMQ